LPITTNDTATHNYAKRRVWSHLEEWQKASVVTLDERFLEIRDDTWIKAAMVGEVGGD